MLPLGLDSFAISAGIQAPTSWQRLRISRVVVLFEGKMPRIGLAMGSAWPGGIVQIADHLGAAAVIGVGAGSWGQGRGASRS